MNGMCMHVMYVHQSLGGECMKCLLGSFAANHRGAAISCILNPMSGVMHVMYVYVMLGNSHLCSLHVSHVIFICLVITPFYTSMIISILCIYSWVF